ncbi:MULTISPECIES: hypothetical protein [unclassified Mesorhizobium]|uniref:hypothetical protein n=1 Tax=unclassified Mesorhizobium TaxID=325217 RepID=UPI0003CF3304|nr:MULTISPECIES: hypothetical protein [unclassified Mesorhizobium]ESY48107.1 hypothetical protein X745_28750 [Mesorhizobium sp. LNJC374B00]ESY52250.1 hypothetical protein X744_29520 [Mesorhizobium sp. LNJC372A00]WJI81109.1 hypothetical protein NLY34_31295 [Mesorhizobium sp. C374B]WJI87650.1 hypothetical protein NLY42_02030 [Mesorhizobium sp. C372A]
MFLHEILLDRSKHNLRYIIEDISATPMVTTRPRFLLIPVSGEAVGIVPQGSMNFIARPLRQKYTAEPNPADEGVLTLTRILKELLPLAEYAAIVGRG